MILSMSSSRALSMRMGTSERWRMRRQTSMPSRSGSMRSRMISEGGSALAFSIASSPVAATRTTNPARFRYIPTKDAMLDSSSTTRTDCFVPTTDSYGGTRSGCLAPVADLRPAEAIGVSLERPAPPGPIGDLVLPPWPRIDAIERRAIHARCRSRRSSCPSLSAASARHSAPTRLCSQRSYLGARGSSGSLGVNVVYRCRSSSVVRRREGPRPESSLFAQLQGGRRAR